MYEVFDRFLATDTWHKCHPNNELRFYQLLHRVVREPAFNPDTMGEYMREKFQLSSAYDAGDYRVKAIDRLTSAAWAVFGYLQVTGQL
jgi:hypothetical protein